MTSTDAAAAGRPRADFIDPAFFGDPFAAIAWLQEHEPVHWYDPRPRYHEPFWVLTKFRDIADVSVRGDLFINSPGIRLAFEPIEMPDDARIETALRLPVMYDDPVHARERRLMRKYFSPKQVAGLAELMRGVVSEVLDAIKPGQVHDFTEIIAQRLPPLFMCDVLGVDRCYAADFRAWAAAVATAFEPGAAANFMPLLEMLDFFEAQLDERRQNPGDDLISWIEHAEDEQGQLHPHRKLAWIWAALLAGQKTVTSTLAGGVRSLLDHPDQLAILAAEPEAIPGAVDEMLRYENPTWYALRTAVEDTEIRGVRISAGQKVYLSWLGGNRDPEVFPEPGRFDVRRKQAGNMSFGFGAHHCLGKHFSRLEVQVLFAELVRRFPRMAWGGEPRREWNTLNNLAGYNPVLFQ